MENNINPTEFFVVIGLYSVFCGMLAHSLTWNHMHKKIQKLQLEWGQGYKVGDENGALIDRVFQTKEAATAAALDRGFEGFDVYRVIAGNCPRDGE